jgi:hypothetical protein
MVRFFSAMRGRDRSSVIWSLILLVVPAAGALLLAAAETDFLFGPEYRARIRGAAGLSVESSPRAQFVSKLVLLGIGIVALIAVVALAE